MISCCNIDIDMVQGINGDRKLETSNGLDAIATQ